MTPLIPSYGAPLIEREPEPFVWLVWRVRVVGGSVAHDHWHLVTAYPNGAIARNDAMRRYRADRQHDYAVERREYGDDVPNETLWWASGDDPLGD